jgi:hypothetical protein
MLLSRSCVRPPASRHPAEGGLVVARIQVCLFSE